MIEDDDGGLQLIAEGFEFAEFARPDVGAGVGLVELLIKRADDQGTGLLGEGGEFAEGVALVEVGIGEANGGKDGAFALDFDGRTFFGRWHSCWVIVGQRRGGRSGSLEVFAGNHEFEGLADDVNIALGSLYIAELKNEFDNLYEAIAASYNGGEDNARRWLGRSKPKEAAIFTSEVGFAESKDYVFKVMGNYRVYRELYTEDLVKK